MSANEHESGEAAQSLSQSTDGDQPRLIDVYAQRPVEYDGTCLRPLGLCELGGCCEVCWYRPDHPRFSKR